MKNMPHHDHIPSTPGKFKIDKSPYPYSNRGRWHSTLPKLTFWSFVFIGVIFLFFYRSPTSSSSFSSIKSLTVRSVSPFSEDFLLGRPRLDNFNDYYNPSLKRARQALLERSGVFIVEGDINDVALLKKLFEVVPFTHVMHLAA